MSKTETTATVELPVTIRISGIAYLAVLMAALVAVIFAGVNLAIFGWVLVIPVVLAFWIHRLRTVVTEDGLRAVSTFRTTDVTWAELDGLQFPKWGPVRAVRTDKSFVKLPAVGFVDLPVLSLASGGRVPDPYDGVDDLA
ncbi:PH domain-containing protein [Gordonia sp. CPCC 205333]|uniref:PH domain-containing protein n=1 Tax=Gordonia sp. CPCC 205333 TaxID=3140790 RepID=UPI003AF3E80C